ncbi:MAG: hypothetical protein JNG90_19450 [Planctomycetaceae bacterium]|nr:hypothetical protein [Planctomycetaceae bacterium]
MPTPSLQVYILTFCRDAEQLYGTTLIFKTLRVGFPNARVVVVDNASLPEVRNEIRAHARDVGATHMQLAQAIPHHIFIERTLVAGQASRMVFLDPDICFWKSVETWSFDELIAGRLMPEHRDYSTDCTVQPRLHTSFLWFDNVRKLLETMDRIRKFYYEVDLFKSTMLPFHQGWIRYDTCGVLYNAIRRSTHAFVEDELDCYDHLFCGTHIARVAPNLAPRLREFFENSHELAKTNYSALRGLWRLQEEYFRVMTTG